MKIAAARTQQNGGRQLKRKVRDILTGMDMESALEALDHLPARRVINPLFSFLYQTDDRIRWRAVTAMGRIVAKLADNDREWSRVVMRRLMWNLNDESGGIGWGSPEAMGEILTRHEGLAQEYASILLSYAREDGNYLEYDMLQRGVLWGIARLADARPHLTAPAAGHIMPCLESKAPALRGLAALTMGRLKVREARPALERLMDDDAVFETWMDNRMVQCRVQEVAKAALGNLS